MVQTPQEIISASELEAAAGNANFGSMPLRDIINIAVLQTASGFTTGHTVRCMMEDLGLVTPPRRGRARRAVPTLLMKGKRYLWACYGRQSV